MKRENAEALSLEDHPDLTVRELAELSGLSEQELHALADIGVITAVNAAAPPAALPRRVHRHHPRRLPVAQ